MTKTAQTGAKKRKRSIEHRQIMIFGQNGMRLRFADPLLKDQNQNAYT